MYYDKKPDFGLALFMIAFLSVTAFGVITYKKPEQVNATSFEKVIQNEINNIQEQHKVKIFQDLTLSSLESQINEFIINKDIVSIQYRDNKTYSALVHYKERK